MMNSLPLTGLKGSQPIGALAAFGLLRVCSLAGTFQGVRLAWNRDAGETAILLTGSKCNEASLIDFLLKQMEGRAKFLPLRGLTTADASEAVWDDLKVEPEILRNRLLKVAIQATSAHREDADFWAAFGSEMVAARSTGDVKPTDFHMTAGQQKFLKSLQELAESLDASPRDGEKNPQKRRDEIGNAIREALFGPWQYRDKQHSLGWDPVTEALYALSAVAPTDAGPRSVRVAVWLAAEALPLFPCLPVGRRLQTRGFNRSSNEFSWPLWFNHSCTIDGLRSILTLPLYDEKPPLARLQAYGIGRIYRSARPTDAHGRGQFRSAVPVTLGLPL